MLRMIWPEVPEQVGEGLAVELGWAEPTQEATQVRVCVEEHNQEVLSLRYGAKRKISSGASPNEKSPNEESPSEESPNEESPNEESPNEESSNEERPKEESPNEESPTVRKS